MLSLLATTFRALVRLPAIMRYLYSFGRLPLLPEQSEFANATHPHDCARCPKSKEANAVVEKKITRTFSEFFTHVKRIGFSPTVCMDVGAAEGTASIYLAFPEALHFAFEPLPELESRLRSALAPYPHNIRMCALMEREKESQSIMRQHDLYGSSMMHSLKEDSEKLQRVRVSTLDKEMEGVDLSGHVLLKTDCQGADLLALKGGVETLKQCDVVIVEASLFRFWGQHQPDFYDIVHFMKQNEFVLYDLLDGLLRPADAALGQIDLVFVKEDGFFRQKKFW